MEFTKIFCKDKEFIQLLKHKNKYDLVLLKINKEYDDDGRIKIFITDNITISCNIL